MGFYSQLNDEKNTPLAFLWEGEYWTAPTPQNTQIKPDTNNLRNKLEHTDQDGNGDLVRRNWFGENAGKTDKRVSAPVEILVARLHERPEPGTVAGADWPVVERDQERVVLRVTGQHHAALDDGRAPRGGLQREPEANFLNLLKHCAFLFYCLNLGIICLDFGHADMLKNNYTS